MTVFNKKVDEVSKSIRNDFIARAGELEIERLRIRLVVLLFIRKDYFYRKRSRYIRGKKNLGALLVPQV